MRVEVVRRGRWVKEEWSNGTIVLTKELSLHARSASLPDEMPATVRVERNDNGTYTVRFNIAKKGPKRRRAEGPGTGRRITEGREVGVMIGGDHLATTSAGKVYQWPARRRKNAEHIHERRVNVEETEAADESLVRRTLMVERLEAGLDDRYRNVSRIASDEITSGHRKVYLVMDGTAVSDLDARAEQRRRWGWREEALSIVRGLDNKWALETIERIEYLSRRRGTQLVWVEQNAEMHAQCHACGTVAEDRRWTNARWECDECGGKNRRNVNAAKVTERDGKRAEARRRREEAGRRVEPKPRW